ncbi:MAG: ABC transporter substrate-binding protein [Saccharofermentanales bacterium]|jgi:peptide/nickel transport system substrate-binding protein|nr:ABC transporter substrate-binding protein [Bacillota bacterium]
MKKTLSSIALFLVLIIVAISTIGCSKDSSTDVKQDNQTKSTEEIVSDSSDSIIRITQSRVPDIDPAKGSDLSCSIAYVNLYDALVSINLNNEIVPQLAKTWEHSADGLEWTFKLREDVTFHDGTPLTASDFVFSLERFLTIGQGYSYLLSPYIERAEAEDEHTVKIYMKSAFAPILYSLCRVYVLNEDLIMSNLAEGDYGEYKDYGTKYLLTNDAGSGAYTVKEMKLTDRLILEQYPGYWLEWDEEAPKIAEIISGTEASTIRTLMSNNELEITDNFQNPETLDYLSTLEGVEVVAMPSGSCGYLMPNLTKAPMDDIHIRKALAYMLDDYTICESIIVGSKVPYSCVPSVVGGYTDQLEQYDYNLEKAEEELKKSKYYGQFDKYPITIQSPSEVPLEQKISLMLQSTAAPLGLTIIVEEIPWTSFIENVSSPDTTAHLSITMVALDYPEAGAMLFNRFHTKMNGTWMQAEWMSDKELDIMIEESLRILDQNDRFSKYKEIQSYIQDNCYTINAFEEWPQFAYVSGKIYYPAAEAAKNGLSVSVVMGYNQVFRDFKVYGK